MNQVDGVMQALAYWLRVALGVFLGIFGVIDGFLHRVMNQAGVPGQFQQVVILVVAALFIVAVLRLFGGIFRLLLVVFLILLVLHVLVPNLGL